MSLKGTRTAEGFTTLLTFIGFLTSVVKPSVVLVLFGNMKEFILGKSLMNVRHVGEPSEVSQAFEHT